MNINELIAKCLQQPGISVENRECSTRLMLKNSEGHGSMDFFMLFLGVVLAYIYIDALLWPAPELWEKGAKNKKGPLAVNFCIDGRCELVLNSGESVYVKGGDISVTECFAQKNYVYPRKKYRGIEFFIDIQETETRSGFVRENFGVDFRAIVEKYCPKDRAYIAACAGETEELVRKLWELYDNTGLYAVQQMKIYSIALFERMIYSEKIRQNQTCTFFTETQVRIATETEKLITQDLRVNYPAKELAQRFGISETSLKNYFRGVYRQNISVYLREMRMNKAAELLAESKISVADTAALVGYANQSKFAAVFKKQFEISPLEYRRKSRLEK